MANKELTVALNMDRTKAQQATNEEVAAMKRLQDLYAQASRSKAQAAQGAAKTERDEAYKTRAEIERIERQKQKAVEETSKKRVEEAKKAEKAEVESFNAGSIAAGQFKGVLSSFSAQMLGFNSIEGFVSGLSKDFSSLTKEAAESALELTKAREAILELAALKGQLGQTSGEIGANLGLRDKTLQNAGEARAFELAARGAGGASIGQQISEAEFTKLMEMSGAFQVAAQIDPATAGTLAGSMPRLMGKQNVSGEEAFGAMRQLETIFKPGSATYTQLSGQLLKGSGLTSAGLFKNVMDQAALLSFFSLSSPEGAGELVNQFTRATVGGLGKARAPQLLGGLSDDEVMKQGEYLSELGAKPGMDPIAIGRLIAGDMRRAKAAGGGSYDPMVYLKSRGYSNEEDIRALMGFAGEQELFESSFAPLAGAAGRMQGDPMADIRGFQASDQAAMARKVELAKDSATVIRGGGGIEYAEKLRQAYFEKMRAEGRFGATGDYATFMESWSPASVWAQHGLEMGVNDILRQEGKRRGMTEEEISNAFAVGQGSGFGANQTYAGRSGGIASLGRAIQERGGDPLALLRELNAVARQTLAVQQRAEDRVAKAAANNGAPGGAAPPLRPPPKPEAGAMR